MGSVGEELPISMLDGEGHVAEENEGMTSPSGNLLMSSGCEQHCVGSCTSCLMRKGMEVFFWSQEKI